jgi:hypothetical protein
MPARKTNPTDKPAGTTATPSGKNVPTGGKSVPAKPKPVTASKPAKAAAKPVAKKSVSAKKVPVPAVPVEATAPASRPVEPNSAPTLIASAPPASIVAQPVPAPVAPIVPVPPAQPVRPLPSANTKPGLVQTITIMTLINGILNILWGGMATLAMIPGVVTLCLTPFTILPVILGIFEIIYAAKLLANPPQPVRPSQTIAVLEICCIVFGNLISLVVGILALVFYGDAEVKTYFARLNGQA